KQQTNEPENAEPQVEETVVRHQDKPAPHLAMVESRRRFGAGAIAAVLLMISAVAFAMLYSSKSPASSNGPAVVETSAVKQGAPAPRKAATGNNSSIANVKREVNDREHASAPPVETKREANDRKVVSESLNERKTALG